MQTKQLSLVKSCLEAVRRFALSCPFGLRVALFLASALGFGYFATQQLVELGPLRLKNPQVLFEVKVIDALGQPVPGASAYLGSKKAGVTDSFGEWRGFIRVPQGKTLRLSLLKKTATSSLRVEKNLLVPLESSGKGGLSVRTTLQLEPVKTSDQASLDQASSKSTHKSTAAKQAYQAVWFAPLGREPATQQNHAQGAASLHGSQKVLNVVAGLKILAQKQGLYVSKDAAWQVALSHLPLATDPNFGGLVRVLAWSEGDDQRVDFLSSYTGSASQTAAAILKTLKLHTPKTFALVKGAQSWALQTSELPFWRLPRGQYLRSGGKLFQLDLQPTPACTSVDRSRCFATQAHLPLDPPGQTWVQTRLRIIGLNEKGSNVYVAGLKANYEGAQQWRFWAQANVSSYVSIEHEGTLIFRQLFDPAYQKTFVLPPSSSALVRR